MVYIMSHTAKKFTSFRNQMLQIGEWLLTTGYWLNIKKIRHIFLYVHILKTIFQNFRNKFFTVWTINNSPSMTVLSKQYLHSQFFSLCLPALSFILLQSVIHSSLFLSFILPYFFHSFFPIPVFHSSLFLSFILPYSCLSFFPIPFIHSSLFLSFILPYFFHSFFPIPVFHSSLFLSFILKRTPLTDL
jgi:hypothetical protein